MPGARAHVCAAAGAGGRRHDKHRAALGIHAHCRALSRCPARGACSHSPPQAGVLGCKVAFADAVPDVPGDVQVSVLLRSALDICAVSVVLCVFVSGAQICWLICPPSRTGATQAAGVPHRQGAVSPRAGFAPASLERAQIVQEVPDNLNQIAGEVGDAGVAVPNPAFLASVESSA